MSLSLSDPIDNAPNFTLEKPLEVVIVEDEQASSLLPALDSNRKHDAEELARSFTSEIVRIQPRSVVFDDKMNDIINLGSTEIALSAEGPQRMLSRASTSAHGSKKTGNDVQIKVANTLAELRSTVDDLNPNQVGTQKKLFGFIPMGKKVQKYFEKYESSQEQLNAIIKSLMDGQDELRKDNAALGKEKENQMNLAMDLSQYAHLAKTLDTSLSQEIERLKQSGDIERAHTLSSEALFSVRQRHQDILTQIAVSVQAVLAMDLIRKNNIELIKGVDRARTTTISALRTAIIVSEALANQKMVLDQIDAVNTTTNNLIASTAENLRQQTSRIHEQAASSGVSVETLEAAFNNIFETMNEIDSFRSKANQSMLETVNALENQMVRAKPYLEKAQRNQALEADNRQGITS